MDQFLFLQIAFLKGHLKVNYEGFPHPWDLDFGGGIIIIAIFLGPFHSNNHYEMWPRLLVFHY